METSTAAKQDRSWRSHLARHAALQQYCRVFVYELKLLEDIYSLFIVWKKFQILVRQCKLELSELRFNGLPLVEDLVLGHGSVSAKAKIQRLSRITHML